MYSTDIAERMSVAANPVLGIDQYLATEISFLFYLYFYRNSHIITWHILRKLPFLEHIKFLFVLKLPNLSRQ